MKSTIFVILCLTLASAIAEDSFSWFPRNPKRVRDRCFKKYQLPPTSFLDMRYNKVPFDPKIYDVFQCQGKAFKIYNKKTGLDVDRTTFFYYLRTTTENKKVVQDCVDKYKNVVKSGEMIFRVINCMENDSERARLKKFTDDLNNGPMKDLEPAQEYYKLWIRKAKIALEFDP